MTIIKYESYYSLILMASTLRVPLQEFASCLQVTRERLACTLYLVGEPHRKYHEVWLLSAHGY